VLGIVTFAIDETKWILGRNFEFFAITSQRIEYQGDISTRLFLQVVQVVSNLNAPW